MRGAAATNGSSLVGAAPGTIDARVPHKHICFPRGFERKGESKELKSTGILFHAQSFKCTFSFDVESTHQINNICSQLHHMSNHLPKPLAAST